MTRDRLAARTKPKNWPVIFDEFNVQFLILDTHDDHSLFEAIRAQPGWTVDFESGSKAILARAAGA